MAKDKKSDEPRDPSRRWWGRGKSDTAESLPKQDQPPSENILSKVTVSRRGAMTTVAASATAAATGGVPAEVVPVPIAAKAITSARKIGQTAGIVAPAARDLVMIFSDAVNPAGKVIEELVEPLSNKITAEVMENFSAGFFECFGGIKYALGHSPLLSNVSLSNLMDESVMRQALESAGQSDEYMQGGKTAGVIIRDGIKALFEWTGFSGAADEASLGDLYLGDLYEKLLERATQISEHLLNNPELLPADRAERLKIFEGIDRFLGYCLEQDRNYEYEGVSKELVERISELRSKAGELAEPIAKAIKDERKAKRNAQLEEYEKKEFNARLAKAPYIYCTVKTCDLDEKEPQKSKAFLITQSNGFSTQQLTRMHIQRMRQQLFKEGKVDDFRPIDTSTLVYA